MSCNFWKALFYVVLIALACSVVLHALPGGVCPIFLKVLPEVVLAATAIIATGAAMG
ncbi:MAG: hypothetical protein HQ581_15685 [Planctomycetes bacterium]|nr:hypothetical protein [Planctomycetota bacterium]